MKNNKLMIEYLKILKQLFKTNTYEADNKTLNNIKMYMLDNKNDSHVQEIQKIFANKLYEIFTSKELNEALNSSDEYKYYKIINIFKIDPFRTHSKFIELFQYTIFIPRGSYQENNLAWFLSCYGYQTPNLEKLKQFHLKNKNMGGNEKYGTLEQEQDRYLKASYNMKTDDYLEFVNDKAMEANAFNRYYTNNPKIDYLNKKLGNIGELYLYNSLVKEKETTFVARDLGNGFGYDIYTTATIDNMKKELLFEVKTTTNSNKTYFDLTDTEKRIMDETLNNSNVEYIVCLVYTDVKNNIFSNKYLKAISNNTFKSIYSDEEYTLDSMDNNNYTFKQIVKQKR